MFLMMFDDDDLLILLLEPKLQCFSCFVTEGWFPFGGLVGPALGLDGEVEGLVVDPDFIRQSLHAESGPLEFFLDAL
jgi:hypothetical protein